MSTLHLPSHQEKSILSIIFFAFCIFSLIGVIPLTTNFSYDTKFMSMIACFSIMTVAGLFHLYTHGTLTLKKTPILLPGFLTLLSVLASTFFSQTYPLEQLAGVGGVLIISLVVALYGPTIMKAPNKTAVEVTLWTVAIAGVLSITQYFGFGPSQLLSKITGTALNPTIFHITGSVLVAAHFSALALAACFGLTQSEKKVTPSIAVLVPLLVISLVFYVWQLSPERQGKLVSPSLISSWEILLDSIRSPKEALIGHGPASYETVYTRFRPLWTNSESTYALIYPVAKNAPLTLIPTIGFMGFVFWGWWQVSLLILASKQRAVAPYLAYPLITTVVLFTFSAPSIQLYWAQALLVFSLLATVSHQYHDLFLVKKDESKESLSVPALIVAGVMVLLLTATAYLSTRFYVSQVALYKSISGELVQDWKKAYEWQVSAVSWNPYSAQLRSRMAALDLTIAGALSQKTDPQPADVQQVTQLLQHAWQEAKATTILAPNDAQSWSLLATVYEEIAKVEPQAASFALQSYGQAVEMNRLDPEIRFRIGSLLLRAENYSEAATFFDQAAQLKPDYLNAYYNFAFSVAKLGDYTTALRIYQQLDTVIPADSPDKAKLAEIINEVSKLQAEASAAAARQQTSPAPSPTPNSFSTPELIAPQTTDVSQPQAPSPNTLDGIVVPQTDTSNLLNASPAGSIVP